MKLPERILSCLRARTDSYFSGNELADELNVSRSAIWKAVEKLRADGYEIDAITNNGSRLLGEPDRLSVSAILAELPGPIRADYNVVVLESIDSTNDGLRRRAEEAAPEGTVVWSASVLIAEDLPTFERPTKATSRMASPGRSRKSATV